MVKRKSGVIFLVALAIALIPDFCALAFDDESSRLTLKELKGLIVDVQFMTDEINELEKIGLDKTVVKTDVELKLRLAGINVVSKKEEVYKIPGMPILCVFIGGYLTYKGPRGRGIAYQIDVELLQRVLLSRNYAETGATTWSISSIGLGYTDQDIVGQIRNSFKDHTDRFINAYLSVNPKEGK
jgi:hypothetical protein